MSKVFESLSVATEIELIKNRCQVWIEKFAYAQMNKFNWVSRQHCYASPGCNGPHFAIETPIRNTCHWLITFLILNSWAQDKEISRYIEAMRKWLLEDNAYRVEGVFKIRQQPGYDICNGVIGPAWVLETLSRLSLYLGDSEAHALGLEIIEQLGFVSALGMWKRNDPLNKNYRIDYTYDHQAWLAASMVDFGILDAPQMFLDKTLGGLMRLRADGRVCHISYASSIRGLLGRVAYARQERIAAERVAYVEKSYHHYVLFPLARMKNTFKNHSLYSSGLMTSAVNYLKDIHLEELENYSLCVSYNAPGFEFPMLAFGFGEHIPEFVKGMQAVMDWQVSHTFNDEHNACLNAPDPLTLTARIYEVALFVEACSSAQSNVPVHREAC